MLNFIGHLFNHWSQCSLDQGLESNSWDSKRLKPELLQMMQTHTSESEYSPPPWSSLPRHNYYFEVVKQGALVAKEFILVGKQPDICDVVLDNPSISRRHAVVQFKVGDDSPHLFDLCSTHGTYVNNTKLPPKIYRKLVCFETIQFGNSNREYILRCQGLEKQQEEREEAESKAEEDLTEFQQLLNKDKEISSKEELKDRYLDLLRNDLYQGSNLSSRELVGKKEKAQSDGISWGIQDEMEVYNYRNHQEYQLDPDVLRRLPISDQRILDRIADLETVFNKLHEVENDLRDLVKKDKKELGLQDKMLIKKENLEKKLMELQQQVDKHQDYIKVNLFGEQASRNIAHEKKEKELDTFEGDEFYDRTLEKKEVIDMEALRKQNFTNTTDDYYKLKQRLEELEAKKVALDKRLIQACTPSDANVEQMDQYELFLLETEKQLKKEEYAKVKEEIKVNDEILSITKEKLSTILPTHFNQSIVYQQETAATTKAQETEKKPEDAIIDDVLKRLEDLKKEEQQIDQSDAAIFKLYEKKHKLTKSFKRKHEEAFEPQEEYSETTKKVKPVFPAMKESAYGEEDFEDLTRFN